MEKCDELLKKFKKFLEPLGYDCAPFLIKWYNNLVTNDYQLEYQPNTLGIVIISTPAMWNTFSKFCKENHEKIDLTKDPLDKCTDYIMNQLKSNLTDKVEIIKDYDMQRKKRIPRILVQTVGHVSGISYYYQRVDGDPEDLKFGVAIHPKFGGYFAFRSTFIFPEIQVPELQQVEPIDSVGDKRLELLKLFSKWDFRFRDVIFEGKEVPEELKYCKEQDEFFQTLPEKRKLPL